MNNDSETLNNINALPYSLQRDARTLMEEGVVVISKEKFADTCDKASRNIHAQRLGSILGLTFYPLIGLLSYLKTKRLSSLTFGLYAAYCAPLHFVGNVDAYDKVILELSQGTLPAGGRNNVAGIEFIKKNIKHVRFLINGSLALYREPKFFNFGVIGYGRNVDLANIKPKRLIPLIGCQSSNAISYYHLNKEAAESSAMILKNRRNRFFSVAAITGFLFLVLSSIRYFKKSDSEESFPNGKDMLSIGLSLAMSLAIVRLYFYFNRSENHLDKIEALINTRRVFDSRKSLNNIIKPEFQEQYGELTQYENFCIYVNGLGGVECAPGNRVCTLRDSRKITL